MTIHNLIKPVLICTLLMGLQFQMQAQDFEGIIYYEIPEMQNPDMEEMPYMIKGNKARIEFKSGQGSGAMLFMPDESKIVFVMDAMKGFMEMNLDDMGDSGDQSEEANFTKTGETKTIADKSCEVWRVESEDNTVEVCMAQGLGKFMMPRSPMARSNAPEWVDEVMEKGAMPLEVIEVGGENKALQMRATRIEEKSLEASLFEVPEGYKDMSSMMKQMMNQN